MPLTHDIGVRIPYPLHKRVTEVTRFFCIALNDLPSLKRWVDISGDKSQTLDSRIFDGVLNRDGAIIYFGGKFMQK